MSLVINFNAHRGQLNSSERYHRELFLTTADNNKFDFS